MSLVKKILFYGLLLCGTLLILITLGSLFYDTSLWYLQILNFPRLGVLIALAVGLVLCLLVRETWSAASLLFLAGMLASIGIQASILLPYTVLADKAVVSADAESVDKRSVFSIVVANVWMPNRQADALLKIINDKDPTLVLTMEVNDWWVNQLSVLSKRYPYHIAFPTDNTYGMALYSKLPLHDGQIQFLNHDSVPSFRANVRLPNGALFQLLTVHPVAPKPSQHPDNIGGKEVGLLKAGRIAARRSIPTVVAGDFNDVGWSYNTKQFAAIGGLNNVGYGRGMFNTFSAQSFILRWPLDYVYVSGGFRALNLERLSAFGSDHFPLYAQLTLSP